MKNLKKVLALVVVFAMMLSTVAFAASPTSVSEGIEDKNVKAAVEKLVAFGIVAGKEDGLYHPEEALTRAQFAKLVVESLGLGTAAQAAVATQFADVAAEHWASGYIAVAAGQGIIKGKGDGNFEPEAGVSYPEAITMLVRALGYKDSFLTGAWPANYVAKAADLDITDKVKYSTSGTVDRGSAAVLVSNTLDAKIIKQTSYGDENNWSDAGQPTLLEEKLNVTKVKRATVTAVPKVESSIDEDQLTIDSDADYNDGINYDNTYDVAADFINIDSLLGLSLNVYLNDDSEVVFVEESDAPAKVVYDVIDYEEDIEADSITLKNSDKEYEFGAGYKIYLDNDEVSVSTLASEVTTASDVVFGKFVFDTKGNIAVADLQKFDGDKARIVLEVDADEAKIIYNVTDADDEKVLDLGDTDDFDKYFITDVNGNAMDIADVEKDDIIYVNAQDIAGDDLEEASSRDTVAYVTVVRNVIEGAAESWDSSEIEIDGKAYKWSAHATATVSADSDDEYELVGSSAADSDLDDITDAEANVVALRDLIGKVRHLRTDVDSTSDDMYGIVTGIDIKYNTTYVKILKNDETEAEYEVDVDTADWVGSGYPSEASILENDIVKFTVDSDNIIDYIELVAIASYSSPTISVSVSSVARADNDPNTTSPTGDATVSPTGSLDESRDKFGPDYIKLSSSGSLLVKDDVVVMDYTKAISSTLAFDPSDAEAITWADLDDKQGAGADFVYLTDSNGAAKFIVFYDGFSATDDAQAGYIVDSRKKDGDTIVDIMAPGFSEVTRYTVKGGSGFAADETPIIFTERNDGKVDLATSATDFATFTGYVSDISGKYFTVSEVVYASTVSGVAKFAVAATPTTGTYKVDSDSVFYSKDKAKVFSDVDEGKTFVTVIAENGVVKTVKIYDKEDDIAKFITAHEVQHGNTITITGSESDVTKMDMQ